MVYVHVVSYSNVYNFTYVCFVLFVFFFFFQIQGLVHKASMCGFSLVPVLPFNTLKPHLPDSTVNPLYPFYHPVTVPLGIPFEQLKGMIMYTDLVTIETMLYLLSISEKECDVSDFIMIRFQLIIRRLVL